MKNLLFLLTLTSLLSCQTNGHGSVPAGIHAAEVEIDVTKTETLIGQPLEKVQAACEAAEVRHRVVEVDGVGRPVTRDFLPERLNFKVKDGKVTEVTKG